MLCVNYNKCNGLPVIAIIVSGLLQLKHDGLQCLMSLDQMQTKIIETVFALEVQKGHLKWSVNQIARVAGISRSLVYYHFGRTKEEIVLESLERIAREFYGLTDARKKLSQFDSLKLSHEMYKNNPSYATFYQKWRHKPSGIRDKYLDLEKRYDDKLSKAYPLASAAQRDALHSIFHGIVTAPFLNDQSIAEALKLLKLSELIT
jgi:AcrR family transcriptional regulator